MHKIIGIVILFFFGIASYSQELHCRVQVSAQQIQGSSNKQIFQTLQKTIYEFINNRRWTTNIYATEERIECTIQINITKQIGTDVYQASMQIQSNRPIYASNYNSVILNTIDNDFQFEYVENQPIEFNETTYQSNLASILAYWAYIIVGLDYDSFSPMGGTAYFTKAERIVNNAQNAKERGWKAFENQKNRYWIIQNILDAKYKPIRQFYYDYHRLGLDKMADKPDEGRTKIASSLKHLQRVYRDRPNPTMPFLQLVLDAKVNEFVNVFSEGPVAERNRAADLLIEINTANTSKYNKIKGTR